MQSVELVCHPWSQPDPVRRIQVSVRRSLHGLALAFCADGDLGRVRVPEPRAPRSVTQLWAHTCFEAFVAIEDAAAYHEFNFSPSGEWAAYAFRSYRDGALLEDETVAPVIVVHAAGGRLALDADVPLERLSPRHSRAPLQLGLSAVVEGTDGTLSYWALRHPAGKPDFHQRDSRVLRLEPPGRE